MTFRIVAAFAAACVLALSSLPSPLRADELRRSASRRLFAIRKTENRNRVEYEVSVDSNCAPASATPVFAYWRMIERGPSVREPLLAIERRAYGFARQRVSTDDSGVRVDVVLRALRERPIVVRMFGAGDGCSARASMSIDGVPCSVDDVLVVQSGPFSVDRIELRGRSIEDGSPRFEALAR